MSNGEITTLRVSTDTFLPGDQSQRDRLDAFREIFGRSILKFEMDPIPGCPFHVDMTLRSLPGVGIAAGSLSPMSNRHTADLIEDDDLVLIALQRGGLTAAQAGREATAVAGQAIVTSNGEVARCAATVATKLVNFRVGRRALADRLIDVDAALIRPIPETNAALRLLTSYMQVVEDERALATAELRLAVATHIQDLIALALGATRDAADLARGRGVRAARLRAIQADITAHITSRDLSIDTLAARHGVSPRYIRALFEGAQSTFTDFVLAQRLARAHSRLLDPRFAGHKISVIAFDCGFGDLSYFNHAFRRRYGETPSDVRARGAEC